MFYTIYKIINQINGKFYIGKHQTYNLDDGYMGSGKLIKYAIEKYGIENFTKEYLGVYDSQIKMDLAEKIYVILDEEVSYNLCRGGEGGDVLQSAKAEKHIQKSKAISARLKGKPKSTEHKINISLFHADVSGDNNPMYGKQHKESTKLLLKERAKNRVQKKCLHCSTVVDASNYARWHGEKCKRKIIA